MIIDHNKSDEKREPMFEFFRKAKKRFQDIVEPILFPNEVARIRENEESTKRYEESAKRYKESAKQHEANTKKLEEETAKINAETEREEQERAAARKRRWWPS